MATDEETLVAKAVNALVTAMTKEELLALHKLMDEGHDDIFFHLAHISAKNFPHLVDNGRWKEDCYGLSITVDTGEQTS